MGPLMKVIASAGFILLLYFGATAVYAKSFNIGDFAAYSLYIERLIWPVATLGWMVTVIYRAKVSGARIAELFAFVPQVSDKPDAIKITTLNSSIKLPYLLRRREGRSDEAIHELVSSGLLRSARNDEYEIKANEMLAIVGAIGSGKSTLARKLLRLEDSQRGEILVDGIDITDISLESLRSVISLVPQDSLLFSATILENILYACDETDPEHARSLASLVAIDREIDNMPQGYDTLVGERGITLSGGQRQRITIARALARKPKVLILDDALSSVDDATAATIVSNIKTLRKGLCTIFITHKLSLAEQMDRILVLEGASRERN